MRSCVSEEGNIRHMCTDCDVQDYTDCALTVHWLCCARVHWLCTDCATVHWLCNCALIMLSKCALTVHWLCCARLHWLRTDCALFVLCKCALTVYWQCTDWWRWTWWVQCVVPVAAVCWSPVCRPQGAGRVSILRCEGSVIRGMSGESAQIWTSCPPCPHLFKLYRKLSCTYKNIVLTNNVF